MGRGGGDPQIASQRQFQPATEADAVDHGHGRPWLAGEPGEQPAAGRAEPFDLGRGFPPQPFEPRNVCAGEERPLAVRPQHDPRRRRPARQPAEHVFELREELLREDVLPAAWHVEREGNHAVLEPLDGDRSGGHSGGRHGGVSVAFACLKTENR